MSILSIHNSNGDRKINFTEGDFAEAQAAFGERMEGGGALAFKSDGKGNDERITEFDPKAENITITSALQGG